MTARAQQRSCPACGTAFTWTPASPRQRFCNTRCRQRWWDHRRRQVTAALNRGAAPPAGNHDTRAGADDGRGDHARSHDTGTLAAVPSCPHCRQPVAIVAWLVPPGAASVATPPRHADAVRDIK